MSRGKDGSLITKGSLKPGVGTEAKEGESSQAKGGGDKGKYKRLEMSIFKGDCPDSWVYRAEHYFEIHELTDEERSKWRLLASTMTWWIGTAGVTTGNRFDHGKS